MRATTCGREERKKRFRATLLSDPRQCFSARLNPYRLFLRTSLLFHVSRPIASRMWFSLSQPVTVHSMHPFFIFIMGISHFFSSSIQLRIGQRSLLPSNAKQFQTNVFAISTLSLHYQSDPNSHLLHMFHPHLALGYTALDKLLSHCLADRLAARHCSGISPSITSPTPASSATLSPATALSTPISTQPSPFTSALPVRANS